MYNQGLPLLVLNSFLSTSSSFLGFLAFETSCMRPTRKELWLTYLRQNKNRYKQTKRKVEQPREGMINDHELSFWISWKMQLNLLLSLSSSFTIVIMTFHNRHQHFFMISVIFHPLIAFLINIFQKNTILSLIYCSKQWMHLMDRYWKEVIQVST